jgi:hypothetical protein
MQTTTLKGRFGIDRKASAGHAQLARLRLSEI